MLFVLVHDGYRAIARPSGTWFGSYKNG